MKKQKKNILALKGLSAEEVIYSREKFGANEITPPPREPWWKLYFKKFQDPIIRILIIAAVIAIAVGVVDGNYLEGIGIILAIFLATTLSFLNEFKASKEFDILNKVSDDDPVKVIRDSAYLSIPKREVVVNDLVLIEMGEEIPADGHIFDAVSLEVNESSLTGESKPVKKYSIGQLREMGERKEGTYPVDKVLRGTLVVDGHGVIMVSEVGNNTEIGKAAIASTEVTGRKTPLDKQLDKLSKIIGIIGFIISGLTFIALIVHAVLVKELVLTLPQWYSVGLLSISILLLLYRVWGPMFYDAFELMGKVKNRPVILTSHNLIDYIKGYFIGILFFISGYIVGTSLNIISPYPWLWLNTHISEELLKFFMISVTMIVVAIPEGLAMSVTLSLAYSIRKMTATNNLVRKMHAVETISAATVICSDKTGTLTLNEMQVKKIHFPMLKENQLRKENLLFTDKILIESIAANTTANLSADIEKKSRVLGNPTEGALLLWLSDDGIDYDTYRKSFEFIYQWTFTTERKFMGTYGISNINNQPILYVKGAPEIILERCSKILTQDGLKNISEVSNEILLKLKEYQNRAMRTLAFAIVENPEYKDGIALEDLAKNMVWLGFVAIQDPIRKEVPKAIKACLDAGISVKMVTGDNPSTAKEIAKQIGLWKETDTDEKNLLLGPEFEQLSDEEACEKVLNLKILSRARPFDKLRLVKFLQKKNQVVAVTGDGTNDAPALNYADVGLAMGKTGTAVAKEAADIILLDDSFNSIVNAVMWGRSLYQNIQKFLTFQLTINVLALIIVLLGPFIGIELTLTVTQMIWVNLIMDTFAALALATSPPSWSVMKNPPRKPDDFIITKSMFKNIIGMALFFIITLTAVIFYIQKDGVTDHELSIFFSLFVLLQFWNLFNAKTVGTNQSAFHDFWENKNFIIISSVILVMQIFIVQIGGKIFRTVPLSFETWIALIVCTSPILLIGELFRYNKRKSKLT